MADEPYILVVDDDAATRDAISLVLGMEGYRVAQANHGREALDYLRSHPPPHAILLDLVTPVMDGREFRREQLQDPELADIPVIVISGLENAQAEAASIGAAGYIIKPIDAEPLVTTVQLFATKASRPEILVAEAQAEAGNLLISALRLHGFTVHHARDAAETLDLYLRKKDRIGLVLLDAALGAPELLVSLRKLNPSIRCCLMNQQASPFTADQLAALGANHVVPQGVPSLAETAHLLRDLACRA